MSYLGCEYVAINEYETAFKQFEDILRILDNQYQYSAVHNANIYLAQLYLLNNELQKSEIYAQRLVEHRSYFTDRAYSVLAEIALRKKDYYVAIDYVKKALKTTPDSIYILLNLASLLYDEDETTALEYIKKTIKKNPYLQKNYLSSGE